MTTISLYTGGGVSLSPKDGPGRVLSRYVRIVADDGNVLAKDDIIAYCLDILPEDISSWEEIDEPAPDPIENI